MEKPVKYKGDSEHHRVAGAQWVGGERVEAVGDDDCRQDNQQVLLQLPMFPKPETMQQPARLDFPMVMI